MKKKTNKKVLKKRYPLAEMAAKQLQSELAPVFAACNVLSKKYAALAASAGKNVKKFERLLVKNPEERLAKQRTAWADAADYMIELAEDLRYSPARGSKFSKTPYLVMSSDSSAFNFRFLDTLAGFEDLSSAAESLGKVAAALRKTNKPTGGAALSGAEKKRSTTKTARKGKST